MNRQHFLGLLAGTLAAGITAAPAFAQEGKRPATAGEKANKGEAAMAKRRAVQGELTKVEGAALTLETKRQGSFVVTTNADTKLRGKGHDEMELADLKDSKLIGSRVIAQGERDGDKLAAKHLIVRPAKKDHDDEADDKADAKRTVTVGVISGLPSSGAITGFTVTPQGGSAVTFVANADTEYNLKGATLTNGQTVRVVSKKDGTNNVAIKVRYPAGS